MPSNLVPDKYLALLACPACHGDVAQRGGELVCACGARYPVTDGIPDMLPVAAIGPEFRTSIDAWNQEWKKLGLPAPGQTEADPAYVRVTEYIVRHAPPREHWGVFLEAGCGNGQVALLVAKRKKSLVVGIDCCLEACRQARALFDREGEEGFFVVGDLRHLPFKDGAIGYMFGWGSLEHFPETQAAVDEAYRTLAPGGRINTSVPVISLATLTYFQLWGNIPELPLIKPLAYWFHHRLLGGHHLQYGYEKSFRVGGLKRYFKRAGFKVLRTGRPEIEHVFERVPKVLVPLARRLALWRWFWIIVYVEGDK
jgi:ubiquinone/menaquinone biosynthesis C-methylase UbiE/uncharacterized protein YbaR (Trm112 family)